MKPISLEEEKKIQFEILKYFADFCDKNGLRYYLAYGTLLGAVRHKGFIPWDDDIDVSMPVSDYKKAIELFNSQSSDSKYRLIAPNDKVSRHLYVKIIDTDTIKIETPVNYKNGYLGVDIDVFYTDGVPEDYEDFLKWCKKFNKIAAKGVNKVLKWRHKSLKSTVRIGLSKLMSLHSREYYIKKLEEMHSRYKYDDCEWVGHICGCFLDNYYNRFKKEWFLESCEVEFEGCYFKAPKNYDGYLTALYGDYMTPPPVDKQISHHANNTFYK